MDSRDKLLIQSHFALVWWAEALTSNYFQTEAFKKLNFSDAFVHDRLMDKGGAAGALVAPSLYVALVLPREAIFDQYKSDFKRLDNFISTNAHVLENTYPSANGIAYTRHLRNATAHARLAIFDAGIEFEDKDTRNGWGLRARIDFRTLGSLVQELNLLLRKHVQSLQSAGA